MNPIRNEQEAQESRMKIIKKMVAELDISIEQADRRLTALIKSDLLKDLTPDDPSFRIIVELCTRIPQLDKE